MNRRRLLLIGGGVLGLVVLAIIVLALLGPAVGSVFSTTVSYAPGYPVEEEAYFEEPAMEEALGFDGAQSAPTAVAMAGEAGGGGRAAQVPVQERLIIRSADLSLVVDDTQETVDAIGQMADAMGGFVVSSNTYQAYEGQLAGDVTIRVPAERFDDALETIKGFAVEVESENISGQDVTEEYVDLQARLESLKAAEERLLEIMANAQNTTDLLQAEQQLTIRQSEIEAIQGRLQFLEQSAALSRITVHLRPDIVSQPVDVRWKPLGTVRRAFDSLVRGLTGIVDAVIFIAIAVLPRLLIIALLLTPFYLLGRALWRRRRDRQQS